MLAAVERAGSDFLSHETRLVAALLGVVATALCVPLLLWGVQQPEAGTRLVGTLLGLLLGGVAAAALARLTHWAAARATAQALADLRDESDAPSAAMFRGALLLALAVDAVSSLLSCLAFLGYYRLASSWMQLDAAGALQEATRAVPVVTLGAVSAALIFQVGGGGFQTAAGVQSAAIQADRAQGRRRTLDEEQNPALVAELVGDTVGGLVSRSTDVFAALMLANAALLVLSGIVVGNTTALSEQAALALVALPLLVRAIGLLAAAVATSSSRVGPGLSPWQAFAGVGVCQALIATVGILGAAFWVLGTPLFLRAIGAGLLGLLANVVCQALLLWPRQAGSLMTVREGSAASATSLAQALGLGLQRAWAPLLVAVACLGLAHSLGTRTGLSHGGAYTLLLAVAGMAGGAALHLCCSAFSSIASAVRRLGALRRAHYDLAARSRATELESEGRVIGNLGEIQAILCGTAAALLGALALPFLSSAPSRGLPSATSIGSDAARAVDGLPQPIVMLGAILGLASLSFYVGGVLRNTSRAASAVDAQLSQEAEVGSSSELDSQLPTSYRGSVVRAARAATGALIPLAAGAVLAPMAMGVLLRLLYGQAGSRLAGHGLMAVAIISVLTGGCAALAARGALMALGQPRLIAGAEGARQPDGSSADLARRLMGQSVGPAALLALEATVASALVILPLLSPSAL